MLIFNVDFYKEMWREASSCSVNGTAMQCHGLRAAEYGAVH